MGCIMNKDTITIKKFKSKRIGNEIINVKLDGSGYVWYEEMDDPSRCGNMTEVELYRCYEEVEELTKYSNKKTGILIMMSVIEGNEKYVFIQPMYSEYGDLSEAERVDYGAISRKRFDREYEKVEERVMEGKTRITFTKENKKAVMLFLKNEGMYNIDDEDERDRILFTVRGTHSQKDDGSVYLDIKDTIIFERSVGALPIISIVNGITYKVWGYDYYTDMLTFMPIPPDKNNEKVEEGVEMSSEMVWQIDENESEGYNQKKLERFFIEILEKGDVTFNYTISPPTFKNVIDYIEFWINHKCYKIKECGKLIFNPKGRFTLSDKEIGIICVIKVRKEEAKVEDYRQVLEAGEILLRMMRDFEKELENER